MGSLFSGKHRLLVLYLLVPTGEPRKPPPYVCSLPGSTPAGPGSGVASDLEKIPVVVFCFPYQPPGIVHFAGLGSRREEGPGPRRPQGCH